MQYIPEFYFSQEHVWLSGLEGVERIGLTPFVLQQLGDVVHLELPPPGTILEPQTPMGTIESTKTVSDLYAPIRARVLVSQALSKHLFQDPFGRGWLLQVEVLD
jgi:glycine cleavage system H protein